MASEGLAGVPVAARAHGAFDVLRDLAVIMYAAALTTASTVRLQPASAAVGQTLKEIRLRGITGARVIAIEHWPNDVVYPRGDESLREGDILVLTGTADSVDAAERLLQCGET